MITFNQNEKENTKEKLLVSSSATINNLTCSSFLLGKNKWIVLHVLLFFKSLDSVVNYFFETKGILTHFSFPPIFLPSSLICKITSTQDYCSG